METNACLIVEAGVPFRAGENIPLTDGKIHIGRIWEDPKPDVGFGDGHISRKHAEISYVGDHFELRDLSKHGTRVNGKQLEKGIPLTLKHDDRIVLARGAAVLRFHCLEDPGKTQDIEDLPDGTGDSELVIQDAHLVVDIDRREVLIGSKELRPRITGYEFELLAVLYLHRGKAVSHEDIVEWVWRNLPNRDTIMRQNVATLVHRLRNCLGECGKYIINVPAYGYRLD